MSLDLVPDLTSGQLSQAEEDFLGDAETLTEWLGAECMHAKPAPFYGFIRELDPVKLTTPQLMAFAFSRGQKDDLRRAAIDEIGERYLKAHQSLVVKRASEIAQAQDDDREAA